jgi:hypothetical protein
VEGLSDALDDVAASRAVRLPLIRATGCAISGIAPRTVSPNAPGFHQAVSPVLRKHCVECHRPGGTAPFSLVTYEDAAPRAAAMAEAAAGRRMPPWKPDPGPPHFLGERRLTALEIATIVQWSRAGAPPGPGVALTSELPPLDQWKLGAPDHIRSMVTSFAVPAGGTDLYRCFVLPAAVDRDRWVRAFEFRPGEPRAVHHALIFVDRSGLPAAGCRNARARISVFRRAGLSPDGELGRLGSRHWSRSISGRCSRPRR